LGEGLRAFVPKPVLSLSKDGKKVSLKNFMARYILSSLCITLFFTTTFGFKKDAVVFYYNSPNATNHSIFSDTINPKTYLATLTFDGNSLFDKGETCFPQSFSFNSTQDANKDGKMDVEDNLENLVLYSIGNNISGTGRTGLSERGPNDQRPAVYFHCDTAGIYLVYEYWLYYADNDWINNHEHDWEKYFVYVNGNSPAFIRLSHHKSATSYSWENFPKEDGFPLIGIHRGSHALEKKTEDGVKISYDGKITANNGKLLNGNNQIIPWVIYSNDKNVIGAISFSQTTKTFYYGDPVYFSNGNEWGDANKAPWERREWNNPPLP
jgi:hypothetical protein